MSSSREVDVRPDCCSAQLAVCCGPRSCRLCCSCCPPARESISTKLIYIGLLVCSSSFMCAMLIPQMQKSLQSTFRDFNATCIDFRIERDCLKLIGYMAVYKISFPLSIFFIALGLFTLRTDSSKNFRAWIHNGFWFFKLIVICTMILTSFFIPISHFNEVHSLCIYATLLGNIAFMVLQTVIILESSAKIHHYLRVKINNKIIRYVELIIVFIVFTIWLSMVIGLFFIHGRQNYCLTKHFIILFNTGLCLLIMGASVTPCVKQPMTNFVMTSDTPASNNNRMISFLQSTLISLYIIYWTWSALQSSPTEVAGFIELYFLLEEGDYIRCDVTNDGVINDILVTFSLLFMIITVIYVCLSENNTKINNHHNCKTLNKCL